MPIFDPIRLGASGVADDFVVERSLRFNRGDNAQLSRTLVVVEIEKLLHLVLGLRFLLVMFMEHFFLVVNRALAFLNLCLEMMVDLRSIHQKIA